MRNWHISRRTFLRGVGAAVSLPLLDAMAAQGSEAQPPVRMAFLFMPNGVYPEEWGLDEKQTDLSQLSPTLSPLESVKDDVLVISRMCKRHSREGDGHYAKTANFLSGMPVFKTTGKNIKCGISIDQLAAQKVGHHTPLPSLELGIEPVVSGIDSIVGYTRLYGSHISWRDERQPVAKEINPRLVFERLFLSSLNGSKPALGGLSNADRKSLLDIVLEDAKDLRLQLGRDDQHKMDEYLSSVRSVEKRIEFAEKSKEKEKHWLPQVATEKLIRPEGIPGSHQEHVRLMMEMIVLAFWTDSTRVSSFMFGNSVSGVNFSFLDGVEGGHHHLSHHKNEKKMIDQYNKISRWHIEQFAWMLEKMRGIKEGATSLLDNSMILFGSGMSDGNRHDPNNLPIILAGKAGGKVDTGRHIATPKDTPLCNLYVSMLERMNVPVESFGDSTGKVELKA